MDNKFGITDALGNYTEIVRSPHRQEEILKEFPWLWGVFNNWPQQGEVRVSNDLDYLVKLISRIPLDEATKLIWVKAYYRNSEYVLKFGERPTLLRSVEIPLPNFQAKKIPMWELVVRGFIGMTPGGMLIQNIILRTSQEIIIFRHPKNEPLNQFIKSLL